MPTLRELLEEGSFKYGTDYRKVESDKDTLVEFETSGIRPKFTLNQPLLYGTQTLRISRRSTGILDDMKDDRNSSSGQLGLLGGFISDVKDKINTIGTKLGVPTLQIPTRVKEQLEGNEDTSRIPETLAKIRKSQEGSIVGKFLKQNAQGTPKQIGRQAIGGAISLGKSALRDAIFGTNGEPDLSPSANDTINNRPFGPDERFSNIKLYSESIKPSKDQEKGLKFILDGMVEGKNEYNSFLFDKSQYNTNNYADPKSEQIQPPFPTFPEFSLQSLTSNIPGKKTKKYLSDSPVLQNRIDKPVGKFNTTYDTLTVSGSIWDSEDGTPPQFADNTTYDDLDFIPLHFYSVSKKKGAAFKATITGLSENFSPSWESSNFIGNPYTIYNYQSIDRDLTFSFSIYSLSSEEHKKNWEKIDFLSSLVYPQNTTNDIYVTPPLLKVTLGNMYKNKLGFIESLSYTIDENTPWEIGLNATKQGNTISDVVDNGDMRSYKLPTIINVSVSYQIIETSKDVVGQKLYPYGGPVGSVEVGQGNFGDPVT